MEPTQDVRRRVTVAALAHWTVYLFVDADIPHPVQDAFQRDPALDAGEGRTGTGVHAAREGDVLANVVPVEPEFMRVLETVGIADGRPRAALGPPPEPASWSL